MSFALCITELAPALQEDRLAAIAKLAAYDVRVRTAGIVPCELTRFDAPDEAAEALRAVRALGHHGVVIDTSELVPRDRLVRVRRFRLEGERLFAGDGPESLVFTDLVALVRIATQTSVLRVTEEERPVYSSRPSAVVREETIRHEHTTANALYLFAHDGVPWILREHEARYLGLGRPLRPTAHENFLATIELLRARAPRARYDDRFAHHPHDSGKVTVARGGASADARHDERLDVLVWALVRWITRGSGSPYRDRS